MIAMTDFSYIGGLIMGMFVPFSYLLMRGMYRWRDAGWTIGYEEGEGHFGFVCRAPVEEEES